MLSVVGNKWEKSEQEKQRVRTKAMKGRERACKNVFNNPFLPTVGLMRCRKIKLLTCKLPGNVLLLPKWFLLGPQDSCSL